MTDLPELLPFAWQAGRGAASWPGQWMWPATRADLEHAERDPAWVLQPLLAGRRFLYECAGGECRLLDWHNRLIPPRGRWEQLFAELGWSGRMVLDVVSQPGSGAGVAVDALMVNGQDLRNLAYRDRIRTLEAAFGGRVRGIGLGLVRSMVSDKSGWLAQAGDLFDGVVLRNLRANYESGWRRNADGVLVWAFQPEAVGRLAGSARPGEGVAVELQDAGGHWRIAGSLLIPSGGPALSTGALVRFAYDRWDPRARTLVDARFRHSWSGEFGPWARLDRLRT